MDEQMQGPPSDEVDDGFDDEEAITPEEQDMLDSIVASGLEYIHEQIRDEVVGLLTEDAKDSVPERIAQIVYRVLIPASEELKASGAEVDMDLMFGAATELIDSLFALAGELGVVDPANEDEKAAALFALVQLHMLDTDADPETKEAAKEMLAQMMEDPEAEGAVDWVKGAIERTGGSAEQSFTMGEQMANASAPQQPPPPSGLMGG